MAQGNKNGLHGENSASFEESFRRLQEVVQTLSEGSLTLQEALSAFEEGMALADRCTQMLDAAELRLKQVSAQATRQAAQSLDELEEVGRRSPAADEVEGVIAVELESYETRLVFELPEDEKETTGDSLPLSEAKGRTTGDGGGRKSNVNLAYSPLPGEQRASKQAPADKASGSKGTQGRFNPGDEMDLDPLFDEDD
jgi:exodeoxyribonuclease VII small subunit